MCQYVLLVIFTFLLLSGIYILSTSKSENLERKEEPCEIVKKKIKHHIPKIMLELYENRKNFDNFSRADIVRSLIPKMSGRYSRVSAKSYRKFECLLDKIEEANAESHVLVFDIPATKNDEEFLNAELRILTIVQANSKLKLGKYRPISSRILYLQAHLLQVWSGL